jgi:hypothetical protein
MVTFHYNKELNDLKDLVKPTSLSRLSIMGCGKMGRSPGRESAHSARWTEGVGLNPTGGNSIRA